MRFLALLLAGAALTGCATLPATAPASAPADTLVGSGRVHHAPGMVSAADPRGAAAGVEMLRAGGSAADAIFATLLALTVVEPQSSGIGGGSFLVYDHGGAAPDTYDARETAPAAARGDWFFVNGKALDFPEVIPGGRSVGVPGNVRMMALAHAREGRLPWARLFAPAIALARNGFAITPRLHEALVEGKTTAALSASGRALFYDAGGDPKPVGTIVRNPDLAIFLEQLARRGPEHFYAGQNASAIVSAVNTAPVNPAPMTLADVAGYRAKERPAVCGTYRGLKVCGMGPPSSGGITVLQILKQLERFDLAGLGPNDPRSWHLLAESMRLAYADRGLYEADGDFIDVPVAGLIDPGYLSRRAQLIAIDRTLPHAEPGSPAGAPRVALGVTPEIKSTSHFVATDRWGEVASLTSTIESAFGSGLMVNGYYLNNELTDFSLTPTGADGRPVANRVEGGKRPRSSMAPSIVYAPDGSIRLAVGAAGGPTIIAQVAKTIIGVVDWKLSAQDAIALPVLFAPGDTLFLEQGTSAEAMAPALTALGHTVAVRPPGFKANAIEWRDGRWQGAADPRSEGAAVAQ
jgi:gamma-glutamyltranspeptidase / glutathione hydrolase